ncbi:MAG: HNH endonuclease, partial [Gemmatimonadaceae bacterium]
MSRSVTWDSELRDLIAKTWRVGQAFTLEDVYLFESHFSVLYPHNDHRLDKLRQTLQHLRDDGTVEFIDDHGQYR